MNPCKAIAAMSENRVIGHNGDIPWHLPEDFKWFKQTTMGGILVMGRKTYESIGRPLPGRQTLVLSRSTREMEGVQVITDTEKLNELPADKTIWIAGGSEIYSLLLPRCNELFLTRVHRECEGDALFPAFEDDFTFSENLLKTPDFTVEHWLRK
ncbi:MAG: dihydrofolate reductase [Coraliomargaritaceae bacterium]